MKNHRIPTFPSRRIRRLLTAAVLGVSAAALVLPSPGQAATMAAPHPILSIASSGGFVRPDFAFTRLPSTFVGQSGELFTQGPTTAIYPGPALPNVRVATLTKAGITKLRALIATAGLDRTGRNFGDPPTADVPSLLVQYTDAKGRPVTTSIPSWGAGEERLTSAQRAARAKVRTLMTALADPTRTFAKLISPEQAYVPTTFAITGLRGDSCGRYPRAGADDHRLAGAVGSVGRRRKLRRRAGPGRRHAQRGAVQGEPAHSVPRRREGLAGRRARRAPGHRRLPLRGAPDTQHPFDHRHIGPPDTDDSRDAGAAVRTGGLSDRGRSSSRW